MNKKLIVVLLLIALVASAGIAAIMRDLASIHITIIGSNVSVQKVQFSFENLMSGDEFTDSKNTTMHIKGIRDPYIRIYPTSTANSSVFDNLTLYIDVQGHTGSIDLLNGGQFAVNGLVGSDIPVKLDLIGKVGTVEQDTTEDIMIVVEVESGNMTVTGTISGTITSG